MRRLLIIMLIITSLLCLTKCGHSGPPLSSEDLTYPTFTLPPPAPSAFTTIPQNILMVRGNETTLQDVANKLIQALDSAKFGDRSFYAPRNEFEIMDGFVLATQWEQIDKEGNPFPDPDRWAINVTPPRTWTLRSIIASLFGPNTGYFRVTVFIVSTKFIDHDSSVATRPLATGWTTDGAGYLPDDIGLELFAAEKRYYCNVYIYEFMQVTPDHYPIQRKRQDGGHPARTHLEKSQLLVALGME